MKNISNIITEIKETKGRIAKEEILKQHADNEQLKDIFKFVYDKLVVTGIAKKKIEKDVKTEFAIDSFENMFQLMKFVKDNNTGSDVVIETVQRFIKDNDDIEVQELIKSVMIKDLPIGISSSTLNKIYGKDFIPKHLVSLATAYDSDKHDKKLKNGFSLSLKIDGNRASFRNDDSIVGLTRSGKIYEDMTELEKEIAKLPKGFIYDGELLAKGKFENSEEQFRATQTILRTKGEKTGIDFIIFDMIPINEFDNGESKMIYVDRIKKLTSILKSEHFECLELVPIFYIGNDISMIKIHNDFAVKNGKEGVMLNLLNSKYRTKRTTDLLKVKTFHSVDLRCIDVKEHKNGNMAGSLICDYKGFTVDVPGFPDTLKKQFWDKPEIVIGKIIEVKYFEESSNDKGELSLRFPSFTQIRTDKNEVSYN